MHGGRWRRSRVHPRALLWLASLVVLAPDAPARAIEVVVAVGEHDVTRNLDHPPAVGGFTLHLTGAEVWHSKKRGMLLLPAFGAMTTEEDSFYGWVGGALFLPLGPRWGLVSEFGAGVYEPGRGRDLGGSLEFRTGIEATYRAKDTLRVGAGLYHLSNARIHKINPGINSLVLTFGIRPKTRTRVWDTAGLR
jgi:hypothetical protein